MKNLFLTLSRRTLPTRYKSFVRNDVDYADIIYGKPWNESFKGEIEMVWYNAAITMTCALKGTSHDKIHQELNLGSVADQRWFRKFIFFHKVVIRLLPAYRQEYLNSFNDERTDSTQSLNQKKTKGSSRRTRHSNLVRY